MKSRCGPASILASPARIARITAIYFAFGIGIGFFSSTFSSGAGIFSGTVVLLIGAPIVAYGTVLPVLSSALAGL